MKPFDIRLWMTRAAVVTNEKILKSDNGWDTILPTVKTLVNLIGIFCELL